MKGTQSPQICEEGHLSSNEDTGIVSPHFSHLNSSSACTSIPEHSAEIGLPQRHLNSTLNAITPPQKPQSLITRANSGVSISRSCSNAKSCAQAWEHKKERRKPIQRILESCSQPLERNRINSEASLKRHLCGGLRLSEPVLRDSMAGEGPQPPGNIHPLRTHLPPDNDCAKSFPHNDYAVEYLKAACGIEWLE